MGSSDWASLRLGPTTLSEGKRTQFHIVPSAFSAARTLKSIEKNEKNDPNINIGGLHEMNKP